MIIIPGTAYFNHLGLLRIIPAGFYYHQHRRSGLLLLRLQCQFADPCFYHSDDGERHSVYGVACDR